MFSSTRYHRSPPQRISLVEYPHQLVHQPSQDVSAAPMGQSQESGPPAPKQTNTPPLPGDLLDLSLLLPPLLVVQDAIL